MTALSVPTATAQPARPTPRADADRLLANTVAIVAGTPESNARQEVAGKLALITDTARARLAGLDAAGDGELFAGVPLGTDDANLNRSFQYLYEIALATRAPGSALLDDEAVQDRVLDGLRWLHERYYGDQSAGYYGNWFHWEIGISASVTRTLVLLAGRTGDLTTTYVASMDAYLRNGKDGDVDLDSRFHTGANLADITTNRVLQGALLGEDARITKALADQRTVFATIDPYHLQHGVTDGYYADGSFIQHHSVAYTGSYGKGLLTRVVQTIKILDGTAHAGGGDLVEVVRGWVVNGFAPLIFEGWMMEVVKGRAVSRTTTGYTDVAVVLEAIVDLADHVPDAAALKGYVKHLRESSAAPLDPTGFVSPGSIQRYADIMADPSVPAGDLNPPARTVAFNAMDRTVHRRPGYAFALARSSDRISRYEYMNGENLVPWFSGDGAHHLYLSGQDQTAAHGVDFLTTVSPYRLPGTTVPVEERSTIPELYGRFWYENPGHPLGFTSSSESQNTYVYFPRATNTHSGGVTLGAYGAASMVLADDVPFVDKAAGILPDDFVAYRNARATKSWFLLDDEIVVLAAGIHDPDGRAVVTTVDSRIAAPADRVVLGGAVPGTSRPRWLRYANETEGTAVGYVFPDRPRVTVELAPVTRSRRVVRAANPDTAVTKNVFTVTVAGAGELAYLLVPGATEAALLAYARGPVRVLANDRRVQAITHTGLGLVAANTFADGWAHTGRLSVHGPASVITRRLPDRRVAVAVSDPTMGRDEITVLLRGQRLRPLAVDEGVEVRRVPGGTQVRARTRQAHGASFTATLGI
ncbi:silent information regulator protein Sir2 [Actinophytocola xinjiangensis]|uniref:Silent information regulator protein Sir2 n=1 Tax=Actinophytocola xinjiangensis TaxID=485602 RepID=A0A7Z0WEQ5_9PSEU|nr:polysaccharide lyase family 8 super-sandwich domain-containing protein [Actinophytocola xinjiangensis]OLF05616.1 silent information regulator protein Sir2 [Actinophytocola xinjiangensis]